MQTDSFLLFTLFFLSKMAHCHSNQMDGPSGGLTTVHQSLIPGGSALSEPGSTTACLPAAPEHHSPITPYCTASANVPLPYSTANHVPIYPVPTLCCTACLYAPLFSLPQYCTASTVSFCTTSTPRATPHHSVDSTLHTSCYWHTACTLLAHCLHTACCWLCCWYTACTLLALLAHYLHCTLLAQCSYLVQSAPPLICKNAWFLVSFLLDQRSALFNHGMI